LSSPDRPAKTLPTQKFLFLLFRYFFIYFSYQFRKPVSRSDSPFMMTWSIWNFQIIVFVLGLFKLEYRKVMIKKCRLHVAKRNHTGAEHSRFVWRWLLKEEKIALPFVKSNCLSMIMTGRGAKFWMIYLLSKTLTCIKLTQTVTTCLSDKITGTVAFTPEIEEPIRLVKVWQNLETCCFYGA